MKTNIFKITFALAVVVAAGYTVYASQVSSEIAGVALDNVEAIASGESGTGCTGPKILGDCLCTNRLSCRDNSGCN